MLSTTILAVRLGGKVAIGGDGQVTLNDSIVKASAMKVRRLHEDQVLVGFAGATADAFALMERFESKLKQYHGNVLKSAYELAREWRTDRILRRLQSMMTVADRDTLLLLSGTGDVIAPDDGIIGIGSGGPYALAAARALIKHTELDAPAIVEEALRITAGICVYTNDAINVEVIE